MSDRAGLLFNEPPGQAGLPFIKSSDHFESSADRNRKFPCTVQPAAVLSNATEIGENPASLAAPEGRPFDPIQHCYGIQ